MGTKIQQEINELTHLSVFSGIGGLDIAGEMAGFRTVGQCEWKGYPTKVLEKHWPHVPRGRDIHTLTGRDFYEKTGLRTVDIVSGGFPCQPFSVAGQRKGKADERYLWPEMLRVVSEIRPTWVVGENVAGLTSMAEPVGSPQVAGREIARHAGEDHYHSVLVQQEKMLLEGILQDLENAGYDVQPFVVPACGVDAPHQRARLCIIGCRARDVENAGGLRCGKPEDVREQPGRLQNLTESKQLDSQIQVMLKTHGLFFGTYSHQKMHFAIENILYMCDRVSQRPHPKATKNKNVAAQGRVEMNNTHRKHDMLER